MCIRDSLRGVDNKIFTITISNRQGSKLKKSSGRLLATNWTNIVARCKFLVASSYNVNDAAHSQGFWYFTSSQSREIHKNMQNTANFGRNLIKYMSVQHIWNFSQLLGLFTCRKLVNLSWKFVAETCKQRLVTPKLPGVDYGRFPLTQNFWNFRFGGRWNTFRRLVPLKNSQKKWKIEKGGPVFPGGISERNLVFHLRFS